MVFSLFDDLDSVNCNQLWQIFYTKRYNFLSNRDRKKRKISRQHKILLRILCCYQKCQNHKKKSTFFQNIFDKIAIFQKNTNLKKKKKFEF